MLNIDEAIAHAREVAEEQRELFRLCPHPSQECNGADICKCLKNKHDGCIKCAEEHEQLAEWLEELKAYKAIGTVKECKNSVLDIPKAYNKAIDDFVEDISLKISDSFIWGKIADCFKSKNINDTSDEIIVYIINTANEIAEQLKKKI